MDNPDKLATQGTQGEEIQSKNTTQYVLDTTIRKKNTNNIIPPTNNWRSRRIEHRFRRES